MLLLTLIRAGASEYVGAVRLRKLNRRFLEGALGV